MLTILLACADSTNTGPSDPASCLDPLPAYEGCIATMESVDADEGYLYYAERWAFDSAGNPVRGLVDQYGDGVYEVEYLQTWDGDGHLLRSARGALGEEPDVTFTQTWTDGLLVTQEERWADGSGDYRVDYAYDGIELVLKQSDNDLDGAVDVVSTYTWESGRMVGELQDNGADGTVDATCETAWTVAGDGASSTQTCVYLNISFGFTILTVYDAQDAVLSVTKDADGDGVVDEEGTWTRDDRCLVVADEHVDYGTLEPYVTGSAYTYDERGRLVRDDAYARRSGGDVSSTTTTTWIYTCP
jgi:hypothetical protein